MFNYFEHKLLYENFKTLDNGKYSTESSALKIFAIHDISARGKGSL